MLRIVKLFEEHTVPRLGIRRSVSATCLPAGLRSAKNAALREFRQRDGHSRCLVRLGNELAGGSRELIQSWQAARTTPHDRKVLYLEGGDQHRGWFHSSLLTSVAFSARKAPYTDVATAGWTLDELGRAMSKSLGNGVDPVEGSF